MKFGKSFTEKIIEIEKVHWMLLLEDSLRGVAVSKEVGLALYYISKFLSRHHKEAFVEIGSYKGKSTIYIAKGIKHAGANNKLYAVDPFDGGDSPEDHVKVKVTPSEKDFPPSGTTWRIFKRNIAKAKVGRVVYPIKKLSKDAVKDFNEPVSFLFIDGSHEYKNVKQDFLLWSPFIIKGGLLAFHDSGQSAVKRVLRNYVDKDKSFRLIYIIESLSVYRKVKKAKKRQLK